MMWKYGCARTIVQLAGERIYRRYGEHILNILKAEYYDLWQESVQPREEQIKCVINGVLIAHGEEMV